MEPQIRVDDSKGLSLVTKDGAGREQTRYLWTALDAIDPDRKYQVDTVRDGGEEVECRCLRRTPNYLPRCELTPLETWFEPIGIPELAGDAMKDLVSVAGIQPNVPENVNPSQFFRKNEPMMGLPHYPGTDLPLVLALVGYRGVREISSLRNVEWESGEAQRIQEAFFPHNWPKPMPFRLIADRIKEVSMSTGFVAVGDDMLMSLDHSIRWATTRVGVENGLLQTRISHQHTYSYSRLALQLMTQLEVEPKDSGTDTARLAKEIVTALLAAQTANTPQPISNIEDIVEQAVKAALLAHGVGAETIAVPSADVTEFKCDNAPCEEVFDTQSGLNMHKSRWCKNKPE